MPLEANQRLGQGSTAHPPAAVSAALSLGTSIVVAILSYATSVTLTWFLMPDIYGVYGAIMALSYIVTPFIVLGFPSAIVRYLPAEADPQRQALLVKSALSGNLLMGGLCVVAYAAASLVVFRSSPLSPLILLVMGSIIILLSIRAIFYRVIGSQFRFQAMAMSYTLEASSRLAISVGLVLLGWQLGGVLLGQLLSGLLSLLAALYFLRHFSWWRTPGWTDRRVLTFSLALLPGGLGVTLLSEMDILGLKAFAQGELAGEMAGYFQAARVLGLVPMFLASGAMTAISPYIAKYADGKGDRGYSKEALRYSMLFSIPVSVALAIIPEAFMALFFPGQYSAAAAALSLLALRGGFLALVQVMTTSLQVSGRPGWPAIVLPVMATLQLGLLRWLIPAYGLVGAAVASVIPAGAGAICLFFPLNKTRSIIPTPWTTLKMIAALGGMAAFLVLFPHTGWPFILLDILLAGVFYLFLLIWLRLLRLGDVETLGRALPPSPPVRATLNMLSRVVARLGGVASSSPA